ncbi:MAG: hypothetical protein A2Y12_12495 [Planctomycetes bacterium GWF2_42_9]|nr:MAG: hypothetical protein A2Y12_12495 [Planctomycetes bacterium GWF2_42_9]
MTAGPTLHYSHANVNGCYFIAICIYYFTSVFWTKLLSGELIFPIFPGPFYLENLILSPLSIYEYPAQIFVMRLLLGILIAVPILASQLMSFKYSLLFVFILGIIAGLPGLALAVLVGAFGAAVRPLRFRSRIISFVLCTSPSILYFSFFGGAKNADSLRWALSYAPWGDGLLNALAIAGIVLLIGHFTRYRPSLICIISFGVLVTTIFVFQDGINLSELDYQLYIAENNPATVKEFQDASLSGALDDVLNSPQRKNYFQSPFYPVETISLRAVLKKEMQNRLLLDRWPEWISETSAPAYQGRKRQLLRQYEKFINPEKQWWKPEIIHTTLLKSRARIRRMPIALYYKAMLSELSPELNVLVEKETLHFYNDYPHRENLPIWHRLYSEFPTSPESIEARWRRAIHLAGMGEFTHTQEMIDESLAMIVKETEKIKNESEKAMDSIFHKPAKTVITEYELRKLKRKFLYLQNLISGENLGKDEKSKKLASDFIILNRHDVLYKSQLIYLLQQAGENSPLKDNIILEQTLLIPDAIERAEQLGKVTKDFPGTDGGIQARFEQASLKLTIWKNHQLSDREKDKYLTEAQTGLKKFLKDYPECFLAEQVQEILSILPNKEK